MGFLPSQSLFERRYHALSFLACVVLLDQWRAVPAEEKLDKFNEYIRHHGRRYESDELHFRRKIFQQRLEAIEEHNKKQGETWTASVNQFTDRTDQELSMRLGWRDLGTRREAGRISHVGSESTIEMAVREAAPETIDWRNLSMASRVYDQGHCGSCWAVATSVLLEAHYEIAFGKPRTFSTQELVSCVQNPRHCGGKGGCDGATVELALDWAIRAGLATNAETPYEAKDLSCKKDVSQASAAYRGEIDADGRIMTSADWVRKAYSSPQAGDGLGGNKFGLTGFTTLAVNREDPLVRALVEKGPVAVAVAANTWFSYSGGVFDNCPKDWVVNHAVTMFGYGVADTQRGQKRYWLIRNSWGPAWGEKGYIRLARRANEEAHCGTDHKPEDGLACEGGPKQVEVCGSCGVLYDSVVPHFNALSTGDSKGKGDADSDSSDSSAEADESAEAASPSPPPPAVDFPLRRPQEDMPHRRSLVRKHT